MDKKLIINKSVLDMEFAKWITKIKKIVLKIP